MNEEKNIKIIFEHLRDLFREVKSLDREVFRELIENTSGDKLGNDIALFYKKLVETGMESSRAFELTREYLRSRLELFKSMIEKISKQPASTTPLIINTRDLENLLKKKNTNSSKEGEEYSKT